ncbi:MAG: sigma-70 family RNA polymerase sigma factor [Planctomycetes bacterium]|nr:sigma-70 family RNA polymerase sigma factor [Planctomycetota bacterium]
MTGSRSDFETRWSQIDQLHASGAGEVWRWFVARYHDYVAGVLRHAGFRATEIDDMLDEFWDYLFKSQALTHADRSRRFRSFLSGVVRNFARVWARDRRRLESRFGPMDLDEPIEVSQDDDLYLWSRQLLSLALDRLARQRPDDAQVLRRFYGIGGVPSESAATIGQDLGRTANAIHQLLFKARGRLREFLSREVDLTVGIAAEFADEMRVVEGVLERRVPGYASRGSESDPEH